jgi:hypothetical protein
MTSVGLEGLPPEILHMIIGYLGVRDVDAPYLTPPSMIESKKRHGKWQISPQACIHPSKRAESKYTGVLLQTIFWRLW